MHYKTAATKGLCVSFVSATPDDMTKNGCYDNKQSWISFWVTLSVKLVVCLSLILTYCSVQLHLLTCSLVAHSLFPPDHETAIMHRLQAVVMEHSEQLLVVVECAAELDW